MTIDEAIEILSDVGDINRCCSEHAEALDMAIKALEFDIDKHDEEVIKNTVESIWGEPCEDCISREAVLEIFGDIHPLDYNANAYVNKIKALPSVQPTRLKEK